MGSISNKVGKGTSIKIIKERIKNKLSKRKEKQRDNYKTTKKKDGNKVVDKKQRMIHDFFHKSTNINVIAGFEEDAVPNNDCE